MPTINFSLKDMENLVGEKLKIEQLEKYLEYGKGEFDSYDEETDEVSVSLDDTNLPYLWSAEGISRLIKGILNKKIEKLKVKKSNYEVIVDESVKKIRPGIVAFVAKGKKVDDYLLKQIIQLQEKLCEGYGRKRKNIAIGIYSYKKIKFPVHYKATDPESIKFIPLDFQKEMTQQEILEEHPKGIEYKDLLKGCKKYPILVDDNEQVLSFPPIINSAITGKVEEGESELLFEATGYELDSLNLAANIFAYALFDRGFEIYSVEIKDKKNVITPFEFNEKVKISNKQIKDLLGLELKEKEIKNLLKKANYEFNNYNVKIPDYRKDILHAVDVIEDLAIMYGYDKIKSEPLKTYTQGKTKEIVNFVNKIRELCIGNGFQEVFSPILSNKEILYEKMNIKDFGTIEIQDYMSETYSVVRSWLIPILFEVLSKNKHVEYPQKIFEQGLVTVRKNDEAIDYERLAIVSAHDKANYTEMKQVLDYLLRMMNLDYSIEETEHDSFISGRVGRVIVNGKKVAFIGEINPKCLENFEIEMPVVALELNLSELFSFF